ncbi:hypothetical protein PQR15_33430 [Streptomyces lydicus]|nr:hypothetical protein [Streptomyces lydicus]
MRTLLNRLDALHTAAGSQHAYRPETTALLRAVGDAAREAAAALRHGARLPPGEGPGPGRCRANWPRCAPTGPWTPWGG